MDLGTVEVSCTNNRQERLPSQAVIRGSARNFKGCVEALSAPRHVYFKEETDGDGKLQKYGLLLHGATETIQ